MKRLLIESAVIVLAVTVWAIIFNMVSANGLSLIGREEDYRVQAISDKIDLKTAYEMFDKGGYIIIDCRNNSEFEQSHIPGSINLPANELAENLSGFLFEYFPEEKFVTYCEGVNCDASTVVANRLKGLGFQNVLIFYQGWDEWSAAGYPVSTGDDDENDGTTRSNFISEN